MIAVDATILAYAANRFSPQHARASQVLEELANGDTPWALPWPAVYEFLRLVTHPHAAVRPLKVSDAWGFMGELMKSSSVRLLHATEAHATTLIEVLGMVGTPGPLAPQLETAVLLREHGVREVISADQGLRRFGFLEVVDPLKDLEWSPGRGPARRYRRLRA